MFIPKKIIVWMVICYLILYMDAFYILNRPETLRGGKYFGFFSPYEYYVEYDKLYGMNEDSFVVIQSWLNICESTIAFIALFIAFSSCRVKQMIGACLCLFVNALTFWKTIIFVWYDLDWITEDAHNFTTGSILCYYIPSSFWIIGPFISAILISRRMVQFVKEKVKSE